MLVLRHDQAELISRVRAAYAPSVRSVLMQAACGWGKTVVFSWLAGQITERGKRVVIIVHRDELLDQVSRTLTEFNVSHGFIAAGRYFQDHRQVYVASVFTLAKRVRSILPPDLVIIDEAHHAVAGSWARTLEAWPLARVLGVTATPERMDGAGLRPPFDALVEGPPVRDLINAGHLSDYKVYAPPTDPVEVPRRMGDYAKEALARWMDKPHLTGGAVDHYRKLAHGKRALVFCVSLEHAWNVAQQFSSCGYRAARIDGLMQPRERRDMVRQFQRGEIQVMTSCEIVGEGYDCPAIECAILLRPTMSLALHLQQVGRALRPYPGKDYAVILDHAANSFRHGLPDEPRAWSLDGRPKQERRAAPTEWIRTCDNCFAAMPSEATQCRYCNAMLPVKPRKVDERDGELVELQRVEARKTQGRARDMATLIELGKQRGYRNPSYWAMRVMQGRGRA